MAQTWRLFEEMLNSAHKSTGMSDSKHFDSMVVEQLHKANYDARLRAKIEIEDTNILKTISKVVPDSQNVEAG